MLNDSYISLGMENETAPWLDLVGAGCHAEQKSILLIKKKKSDIK